MEDKTVWQSEYFPKMILTESHLEALRHTFPKIEKFEPELKKAELWLLDHKDKRPRSRWRVFISNWMKKAAQIKEQEETRAIRFARQGDAATQTNPRLLSEILRRAQG